MRTTLRSALLAAVCSLAPILPAHALEIGDEVAIPLFRGSHFYSHPSWNVREFQVAPIDFTWTGLLTYDDTREPVGLPPLHVSVDDVPSGHNVLHITEATADNYGLDWGILKQHLQSMYSGRHVNPRVTLLEFTATTDSDTCTFFCETNTFTTSVIDSPSNGARMLEPDYVKVETGIQELGGGVLVWGSVSAFGPATVPEPSSALLLLFGLCVCVLASRHHHTAHFFRQ